MEDSLLPTRASGMIQNHAVDEDPLDLVRTALSELPAKSAPGMSVIGALKGAWAKVRAQALRVNRGEGGRMASMLLAEATDRLLTLVANFAAERAGVPASLPGVALVAMGSYG